MKLTAADIAEIARLLDEARFASLDLQMGDFRVRIRRDSGGWSAPASEEPRYVEAERAPAPIASPSGPVAGETDVRAPLLGNFYSAPRPGDPPFVEIGSTVTEDTTIGIIEVMKLMNPIRAGVAGTVTAILTVNGTSVEEGQPLIRVKAA
ncbi:MAG TPA: biotin/lipoyl-containing protein [Croceibacterium sp.]|nr:biotin/lipoyl-containing protein [Croceibacterium sp.]